MAFRRFKIKASTKGLPIPSDQTIFHKLLMWWGILFVYLAMMCIINAVSESHAVPPYEICLQSHHLAESLSIECWQNWLLFAPVIAIVLVNIYFDYNDTPIFIPPSLFAINHQQEHPTGAWDKAPIKTCYISIIFTAPNILQWVLNELNVMELEDQNNIRIFFNILSLVTLLKAPIMALWTHHFYQNQTKNNQAQLGNNIELHSITSENQRLMKIESE